MSRCPENSPGSVIQGKKEKARKGFWRLDQEYLETGTSALLNLVL